MKRNRPIREVFESLTTKDKYNKEGFPAYSADIRTQTINVLMTGTLANTFYCSSGKLALEQTEVLDKMAKKDLEFLAKATIYARNKGYQKTIPILSSVVISKHNPKLFKKIVNRVCLIPSDWTKLVDICRSKFIRGTGRSIKEAIINYIASLRDTELNDYYSLKYRNKFKDLINIAHPRPEINPELINYVMKREATTEKQKAYKKLIQTKDPEKQKEIILEYRLPYEVVTPVIADSPEPWEALLEVSPYFNFIRNLNTFDRHGVFNKQENITKAVEKITNRNNIRNSKLFPFRFYAAYKMIRDDLIQIKTALQQALEISVENVPEISEKVAILSDISGSMYSNLTSDYSVVQCIDIVGLFTGILKKKSRDPVILPFNDTVRLDVTEEVNRAETIFNIVDIFNKRYGGGTSLAAPMDYMIQEKIEVDKIVAFTDSEEWLGSEYYNNFEQALIDYINKVNPDVEVYLFTLLPYRDYPVMFEKALAKIGNANIHGVFGWSDSVLNYITMDKKKQIEDIENIEL